MRVFPLVLLFVALAAPAQAYIDPNTGGLIVQILTPLLLAMGVFWGKLRKKFADIRDRLLSYRERVSRHDQSK